MATAIEDSPDKIIGFSRRRLAEVSGVGLCAIAFYVLLSLLSHSSADPSWNHSSAQVPVNMGGIVGAFISDLLLQFVGLAGILMALVPAVWGWRLITGRRIVMWSMRFTMLVISLPLVASLLSMIESPLSYPYAEGLGGSIGRLVHDKLSIYFTTGGFVAFTLVMSAVTLWTAFGLTLREWAAVSAYLLRGMRLLFKAAGLLKGNEEATDPWWQKFMFWRHDEADEEEEDKPDEKKERRKRAPKKLLDKPIEKPLPKLPVKEAQSSLELKKGTSRAKKGNYQFPALSLLAAPSGKSKKNQLSESALAQNARLLESVLKDFGVNGEITKVRPGPVVTLYELEPSPGTKSARVIGLADDIARSMSAISARVAVIPGRNAIGIELPNTTRETVYLRELLEGEEFLSNEARLPLALGKDISGMSIVVDLSRMPHLLVAGTTGSGKSVAINTMIMSLIYHLTPEQCKFIMIDPKMLELSGYDNIPHLLAPVVTEPGKAVVALKWTVKEMENRYRLMSNLGVRNIDGYNKRITEAAAKEETLTRTVQTGFDPETGKPIIEEQPLDMNPLPYIVVVVDEMADLMLVAGKEIESSVQRLAQMARAAGIHIIMATQRPSVDVITGVIKANFPTRISFQVTSRIDSRTILGEQGAEQLLGQGDMLYMAGGGRITRVHGPFVSDKEVEKIVAHVKEQGSPHYVEDVTTDDEAESGLPGGDGEDGEDQVLYDQALAIVLRDRKASTSYIQRHLKIGYNRAARLVDRMEREGVVGAANHVGKREVLMR